VGFEASPTMSPCPNANIGDSAVNALRVNTMKLAIVDTENDTSMTSVYAWFHCVTSPLSSLRMYGAMLNMKHPTNIPIRYIASNGFTDNMFIIICYMWWFKRIVPFYRNPFLSPPYILIMMNNKQSKLLTIIALIVGFLGGALIMQIHMEGALQTISNELQIEIDRSLELEVECNTLAGSLEEVETKYDKFYSATTSPTYFNDETIKQLDSFGNITLVSQATSWGDRCASIIRENCDVVAGNRYASYSSFPLYMGNGISSDVIIVISGSELIYFIEEFQQLDTPVYALIGSRFILL